MPSLGKKLINKALGRDELVAFLADADLRNAWVKHKGYEVYLRKSNRAGGKFLDLASIQKPGSNNAKSLPEGSRPKRGRFGEVLTDLESAAKRYGMDGVFVESIQNEFLPHVLGRRGYSKLAGWYDLSPYSNMQKRVR